MRRRASLERGFQERWAQFDTVSGARLCPAKRDQPQPLRKTSLREYA